MYPEYKDVRASLRYEATIETCDIEKYHGQIERVLTSCHIAVIHRGPAFP